MLLKVREGSNVLYLEDPGYLLCEDTQIIFALELLKEEQTLVRINQRPLEKFDGAFTIKLEDLSKETLTIEVVVRNVQTKKERVYKSNPIPLEKRCYVGLNPNSFPQDITSLTQRVNKLEEDFKTMKQALVELAKKGELL